MEASELEDVEVGKVAQRHPSMHHAPGHLLAASLQLLDAHLQLLQPLRQPPMPDYIDVYICTLMFNLLYGL